MTAGPVSEGGGVWIGVCDALCVMKAIHGAPSARACSIHSVPRRLMKLVRYSRHGSGSWIADDPSVITRSHA